MFIQVTKEKLFFIWFQLNGKLHFLDRMSFSVEGCLDPNGIMPQGETYAVSPIQLSYSPYSMSAVYAAPLVPVSVKFNSAQQGKRRPVWIKALLQVPWVPTAEDVPRSKREKTSGTHDILQEARLKKTAGQRTMSGQEDYLSGQTMFSLVRLQYVEVIMTHQKRDVTKLKFLWQLNTTSKSPKLILSPARRRPLLQLVPQYCCD